MTKELNFFSVSSDGRVTLWTMSKSELTYQDVMELKLVGNAKDGQVSNTRRCARRSTVSRARAPALCSAQRFCMSPTFEVLFRSKS